MGKPPLAAAGELGGPRESVRNRRCAPKYPLHATRAHWWARPNRLCRPREREKPPKKPPVLGDSFFLDFPGLPCSPSPTFAPSSYFCTVPLSPGLPMFYLDSLVRRPRQAAFSGERTGHLRALTAMKISAILQYIEFSLIWTESYFMSRNKFHMTEWRPSA